MGRTGMSTRELERARILAQVLAGALSLAEGATLMGVSYRQAKRLRQRFRAGGARALQHRLVGRASNRAWDPAARAAMLAFVAGELSGPAAPGPGQRFGPTLAAEHVADELGCPVAVTTLRRWMQAEGLWTRRRALGVPKVRRPRVAHFGELVQLDGSPHAWFEDRGPPCCLLEMVDDATGRTLQHFAPGESADAAVAILRQWVLTYGVPRAIYLDGAGVYRGIPAAERTVSHGRDLGSRFGHLCAALGIQLITAGSPQAKGRVERAHGTHQDRLIKKMRRVGIATIADGNAYLARYTPQHNARFAVPPAAPTNFHRPPLTATAFDALGQAESERVVGRDGVIRYLGRELQLERSVRRRVPDGTRILVQEAANGVVRIIQRTGAGDRTCAWHEAPPRPAALRPRRSAAELAEARRPRADHPWRKTHNSWCQQSVADKQAAARGQF